MNIYSGLVRASEAAERSIDCQRVTVTKDAVDRIVGTPTNPKPEGVVRDPGGRTSHRDGSMNTASLLVVLAVKEEARWHTLNRAGRDSMQLKRGNSTCNWRRQ